MFKPTALFIGLRYTRAKRRNHFISFISFVSVLGIALGITVLITVLSVMNGFDKEIKKSILTMVPPLTVTSYSGGVSGWQDLQTIVKKIPTITASAPFVTGEALISSGGSVQPTLISGILPLDEINVSGINDKIVSGNLNDLKPGKFNIILGESLADRLGVVAGDKIIVFTPQMTLTPAGIIPRSKRLNVVGIFRASTFRFDLGLGYMNLADSQKLFGMGKNVTGLHLNTNEVFAVPRIAQTLANELSPAASISTWMDQFGDLFRSIQLEKTMMFFILLLIIVVAAFNLVSTLIMVVGEKEADIAILRTLGATPRMIMTIFIIQGGFIGIFGTLLGVLGGLALASHVTEIVNWLEKILHVSLISSGVYFLNYLPSVIEVSDIIKIAFASLFLSLLATIYPAWRAAKLDPVESLRYE